MGKSGCFPPWESQLRQSRATKPTVHAGCFSVSITHRTLTWTTWSLTCAQMLINAIAHGGVWDTCKRVCTESWVCERKIPCRTGESNQRRRRDGPTLYQLSYIFTPGESQLRQSRYTTYGACWAFSCFHNPPNSDVVYRIFNVRTAVDACDCTRGCTDTRMRVCAESLRWEKKIS